jgi:hypothetical protein
LRPVPSGFARYTAGTWSNANLIFFSKFFKIKDDFLHFSLFSECESWGGFFCLFTWLKKSFPCWTSEKTPDFSLFLHAMQLARCYWSERRYMRLTKGNAKCRHLKKLTYKETLRQVFIFLRPRTPSAPLTRCTCIQYTYSHREGGRIELERRLEGQQFTKLGRKYQHDWLYPQSINSDKQLAQSPFTSQFFRWRHFALVSI